MNNFHKQYCNKKIKLYCDKMIFFFFIVWIENLNSWLFQLILKRKSNILTKKILLHQYWFIFYRNIACENCPSDEGLNVTKHRSLPGSRSILLKRWLIRFAMSIPSLLELLTEMTGAGIGSTEIGFELSSPMTETDGIGKTEGRDSIKPKMRNNTMRRSAIFILVCFHF
jgi:hypothetical protein